MRSYTHTVSDAHVTHIAVFIPPAREQQYHREPYRRKPKHNDTLFLLSKSSFLALIKVLASTKGVLADYRMLFPMQPFRNVRLVGCHLPKFVCKRRYLEMKEVIVQQNVESFLIGQG